jgi:hypothetical protein
MTTKHHLTLNKNHQCLHHRPLSIYVCALNLMMALVLVNGQVVARMQSKCSRMLRVSMTYLQPQPFIILCLWPMLDKPAKIVIWIKEEIYVHHLIGIHLIHELLSLSDSVAGRATSDNSEDSMDSTSPHAKTSSQMTCQRSFLSCHI